MAVTAETARARTFRLRFDQPVIHQAGQHFVIRLTAPDGYTAARSYSIASPPEPGGSTEIDFTIERLDDGEVSTFLHDVVEPGDELEVRGPIGGWFVWDGTGPVLLIGGGSGVVPLMAMLRLARRPGRDTALARLVLSVRSPDDLYYAGELPGPDATVIYTRRTPPGTDRSAGRLVAADLPADAAARTAYVCGSTGFADHATDLLLAAGVRAPAIRVERFGPTA